MEVMNLVNGAFTLGMLSLLMGIMICFAVSMHVERLTKRIDELEKEIKKLHK
jgi:hypothetical protein